MLKLIDNSSYYPDEPTIKIIDTTSYTGLVKRAADDRIAAFMDTISPKKDCTYLQILAMSAGESYGPNRNMDFFPRQNLIDCHKTFETAPAHLFANHVNKNPDIAMGKVIYAFFNERMDRVELVVEVWNDRAIDLLSLLHSGEWPATSMALRTPFDTCSQCQNRATSRSTYCTHLRNDLGKMYPDGKKVYAINDGPLKMFDISWVGRPADAISAVMQKLAFVGDDEPIVSSAEMAEQEGMVEENEKTASIKKLADFIKQVDGQVIDSDSNLQALLDRIKDPDPKTVDAFHHLELDEVFNSLADLGMSPSISYLSELIARKLYGHDMKGIGEVIESIVAEKGASALSLPKESPFDMDKQASLAATFILKGYVKQASLHPDYLNDNLIPATNVGYTNTTGHIEPTPYEVYQRAQMQVPEQHMSLLKKVLTIGGMALLAKWLINKAIDDRIRQRQAVLDNSRVKIQLTKSATDYRLTQKLLKQDLVQSFSKN